MMCSVSHVMDLVTYYQFLLEFYATLGGLLFYF